jgi:Uma2 family endonuclease
MTVELRPGPLPSDVKPLPAGPITYEEFLEWADEDTCAEWVGGEVELMSPASVPHQDLSLFLARVLAEYTETHQSGKVLAAPFQMRLGDVQRGREPDILFIADNHLDRLRRNYLEGAADLVVEIVSPESVLRDRGTKYGEYEVGGVREYWVLDPETSRADFFVLDDMGRYQRSQPDAAGLYYSAVIPGFWLNVEWLWQEPLPTLRQVLTEWEKSV